MAEFRLSNFTSGSVLTAAELNTGLTYATYTPVWVQGTKTITNTVDFAVYTQFGKFVSGSVKLISTTTGVSGQDHKITLPVAADKTDAVIGSCWWIDGDANYQEVLATVLVDATNVKFISSISTAVGYFNRSIDINNSIFRFDFTYEAA